MCTIESVARLVNDTLSQSNLQVQQSTDGGLLCPAFSLHLQILSSSLLPLGEGMGVRLLISDCLSLVKFPAAGLRNNNSGSLGNLPGNAYYWSSSPNGSGSNNGGNLNFNSGGVNPRNNNNRSYGFSVRCVSALAA